MPGICVQVTRGQIDPYLRRFRDGQSAMVHFPDYVPSIDLEENGIILGHVAYPEYPIQLLHSQGALISWEGRIYNRARARVEAELKALSTDLCRGASEPLKLLKSFILDHDGEYVILVVAANRRSLWIINDPLGRLPLYYCKTENSLYVGRECKFITQCSGSYAFDRIGWAEHLWMGYSFGGRTLFENIARIPAGMVLSVTLEDNTIATNIVKLFDLNFDKKDSFAKNPETYANDLVDLFCEATRVRVHRPDVPISVVSLSGGQDSRAVAAACARAGVPMAAATFLTADDDCQDSQVAEQIAQDLDIPWYPIGLHVLRQNQEQRLVCLKDGLNYVAMAFILPFMEEIVARWGRNALYLTGDGGDKVMPNLMPYGKIDSVNALVGSIIKVHAPNVPPDLVERAMQLPRGTLVSQLYRAVEGYPESDIKQRAVHFAFEERGRHWLYEGEDRARFFLWQTSPFFCFEFLQYAMSIPDQLKSHYKLYRLFQMNLSQRLSRIPDASKGLPIASRWFSNAVRIESAAQKLPSYLRRAAKRMIKRKFSASMVARNGTVVADVAVASDLAVCSEAVHSFLRSAGERERLLWRTLVLLHERSLLESSLGHQSAISPR